MARSHASGLTRLADLGAGLKRVRRTGWVDRRVESPESVADHAYRVALLAWYVARTRGLDAGRATIMALLHDLPEAELGDATPFDPLRAPDGTIDLDRLRLAAPAPSASATKQKREAEARLMAGVAAAMPPEVADQIVDLWAEYREQQTPEARLVKEIDRLETVEQALRYRNAQPEVAIESFLDEVRQNPFPEDTEALIRPRVP